MLAVVVIVCCASNHVQATSHNQTHQWPRFLCNNRQDGFFVRDVTACNAFFHCNADGIPWRGYCDPPFLFDEPRQKCDFDCNVNCFECPSDPFVELEINGACRQFVRCIQGRPEHLDCAEGLLFDPVLGTCNHAHLVECVDDTKPPGGIVCPAVDDPENRVFIRDPHHCDV